MLGTLYIYNKIGWLTEQRELIEINKTKDETDKTSIQGRYRLTKYEYDLLGRLTKEIHYLEEQSKVSSEGRVRIITSTYDKSGRRTSIKDNTGAKTEYIYDMQDRIVEERQKINNKSTSITKYSYDSEGKVVSIEKLQPTYNQQAEIYANTKLTYDKNGNITKITTPTGNEIRNTYDKVGRKIKEQHIEKQGEINNTIEYEYDKADNIVKVITSGRKQTYIYDSMNRLIEETTEDGAHKIIKYDKNGNIIRQIFPEEYAKKGKESKGYEYRYDLVGRLQKILRQDGQAIQTIRYNKYGEIEEESYPEGASIRYKYDHLGRKTSETSKGGRRQEYSYDAWDNIIAVKNGDREKTTFTLDDWGRINKVTTPSGIEEFYEYDYAGNIIKAINGEGKTIEYAYNKINKLESISYQDGKKESYLYDLEGRLSEETYRDGTKISYSYNMYDSIKQKGEQKSNTWNIYSYNADGSLKTAQTNHMRYDYEYDKLGRLKRKKASSRVLVEYEYDLNGRKVGILDITGKKVQYKYNDLEQLEEVWDNGKVQAKYSYYSDGKIKQVQGENLNTYYAYDEDRNLIGLETKLGTESIVNNTYKYDMYGNCIEKEMIQGIHKYEYDSEDRLTKATYPTYTEEYTYDKVGNRKKRILREVKTEVEKPRPNINASASGYTYNPRTSTQTPNEARQRMETVSQTPIELNKKTGLYEQIELYHYNENNQLIKKTAYTSEGQTKDLNHYVYDVNGNLVEEKGVKNTYNVFNQLETVTKADGTYQKNTYDAEELRYQTEENHKLVQYIYNEDREIITELTKQGAKRYVRGYELITSECYRTRNYYHYASDERGSITHVLEEGQIKNFYEYDVFGNVSYEREEVENYFKYTGEKHDQTTNQIYLRARYYNPVIGRFTQQDTYHGDGLNLYSYVANNPILYVDPSGHVAINDAKKYIPNKITSSMINGKDNNVIYDDYRNSNLSHKPDIHVIQYTDAEVSNYLDNRPQVGDKNVIKLQINTDSELINTMNNNGKLGLHLEHMLEQEMALNDMLIYNRNVLEENIKWSINTYSSKNKSIKKPAERFVDSCRRRAKAPITKVTGVQKVRGDGLQAAHALDTISAGNANVFVGFRDTFANGQMGRSNKKGAITLGKKLKNLGNNETQLVRMKSYVTTNGKNTIPLDKYLKQNGIKLDTSKTEYKTGGKCLI